MVVQPQEVLKSLHFTQIRIEARGRGRGRFGGRSTNQNQQQQHENQSHPMEEDVVTLEAGGAKEDEVHGKEINK